MRKNYKLNFISDPGHGWLQVPWRLLEYVAEKTGYRPSAFSYVGAKTTGAYLEEDRDAPKFTEAAQSLGIYLTFVEKYVEKTRIRSLQRFPEGPANSPMYYRFVGQIYR